MTSTLIRVLIVHFSALHIPVLTCIPLVRNPSGANDCFDIRRFLNATRSGFYDVTQPACVTTNAEICVKRVYCDMVTEGGGWTVIQQRKTGSLNFFLSWSEYKFGFGNDDEFWIGNEYLYTITNRPSRTYELLITAQDEAGRILSSRYGSFRIGSETGSYELSYSTYTGNYTVDNLSGSRNQRFGTFDKDTDDLATVSCGTYWHAGWWFEPTCQETGNLNIPYQPDSSGPHLRGIRWKLSAVEDVRLVSTEMKIRPVDSQSKLIRFDPSIIKEKKDDGLKDI